MFFGKKKTEDFVDLSFGRVYIRPLRSTELDIALSRSTAVKNLVNNHLFLAICERFMTQLYFWEWRKMTVADGNKLRDKIIELLERDKIVSKETEVKDPTDEVNLLTRISPEDQEWFRKAGMTQSELLRGQYGNRSSNKR